MILPYYSVNFSSKFAVISNILELLILYLKLEDNFLHFFFQFKSVNKIGRPVANL